MTHWKNSHFCAGDFLRLVRTMTTIRNIVTMKPTPPIATMAHAHPGTTILGGGVSSGEPGTTTCTQYQKFTERFAPNFHERTYYKVGVSVHCEVSSTTATWKPVIDACLQLCAAYLLISDKPGAIIILLYTIGRHSVRSIPESWVVHLHKSGLRWIIGATAPLAVAIAWDRKATEEKRKSKSIFNIIDLSSSVCIDPGVAWTNTAS